MILTVLCIDNRYSSQQELIEIDKLKKIWSISNTMHWRSSELMEKRTANHVLKNIFRRRQPQTATNRPYLIKERTKPMMPKKNIMLRFSFIILVMVLIGIAIICKAGVIMLPSVNTGKTVADRFVKKTSPYVYPLTTSSHPTASWWISRPSRI